MSEKQPTETNKQSVKTLPLDCMDMLMNSPIGIFASIPTGRFVYVNRTFARMFGYDSTQEMIDSISDIRTQIYANPEEREKIICWLDKNSERLNNECCSLRKDGSQFWTTYNVRAVRDEKGNVIHYEGFVFDITEQKQKHESLLKTQFTVDMAPDSILWLDDEGRIVYANNAACTSMGYTGEELLAMKIFDIDPDFPPEHFERHKDEVRQRGYKKLESRHRTKDGRVFPVEVSTRAFEFGDRSLAVTFDRDISERKEAEKALRESEEKHRGLVEGLNEILFRMILPGGAFEYISPAIIETAGYSAEEIIANPVLVQKVIHPDFRDLLKEIIADLPKGKVPPTLEFKIVDSRGKERWILQSNKGIFDDRGKMIALEGVCRDITERKRTEEALRESGERLRLLSDVTMEGIIIHKNGVVNDLNLSVTKIFGYQRDELLGSNIIDLVIHEDDKGIIRENIVKEYAQPYVVRCVRKNGDIFFAELEARNFKAKGNTLRVVAVRDITERMRTENALRESEGKFRILADSTPTAVMLYQDDRYIYVNRAATVITGYSAEDLLGMCFWEFIHPDYQTVARERGRERQRGRETIGSYELEIVTKDGKERWGYLSGATTMIGGRPAGIISAVDITDRKRAEESLRESELKYRFLTESMTDIVWTTDLDFRITYVSPSIEKILGFTPGERMLQNVEDTMTKESYDRAVNLLSRELEMEWSEAADPDRFTLVQTEYYHKKGHTVWMESNVRFIRGREGGPIGIHGVSRDITERKHAEEEREKLKAQLNQAHKMEAIGTLAGGIAHDFNNLLMGIQGNASLMMLELDLSDPLYERLQQIEEQVKSGADLTRQLMGFARGGRYEMNPTDMNEIIEKTAVMFGRTKKEFTIYKKYEKDLWAAEVDRTQMGQVFMNLLVNAWQAMPGGGEIFLGTDNILLDEAKAAGLALSPGKYVRISVSDTGTGMDAKTLERIFDPFFTTKEMGRGTGLGLATVYGIIKGHGGLINVTSKPGEGTTFEIYLPATEKAVVRERAAQTQALRGTETILLVDDETAVLDVTKSMLQSLGYRVLCAGSGQDAIAVYSEKRDAIDLVILDMIMPGISGTETFDCFRKIDAEKKVLLSSGYSIEGKAQELIEKGCKGFLQKPFRMVDLAREVRAILDSRQEH